MGQFSKVCRSGRLMWNNTQQPQINNNPPARRTRNIQEKASTSSQTTQLDLAPEQAQASIDPESTYYVQKIINRWNQENHFLPKDSETKNPTNLSVMKSG